MYTSSGSRVDDFEKEAKTVLWEKYDEIKQLLQTNSEKKHCTIV